MLLQNGEYRRAAQTLVKYHTPQDQSMLPVYKTLALEILAGVKEDEFAVLKEML